MQTYSLSLINADLSALAPQPYGAWDAKLNCVNNLPANPTVCMWDGSYSCLD